MSAPVPLDDKGIDMTQHRETKHAAAQAMSSHRARSASATNRAISAFSDAVTAPAEVLLRIIGTASNRRAPRARDD